MKQPEGYEVQGSEKSVCLLVKSLYGLKQAPRCWHHKISSYLKRQGELVRSDADSCVYVSRSSGSKGYIALYVDDLLIACADKDYLAKIKQLLQDGFEMKDMGEVHYLLGIRIKTNRAERVLTLDQIL